VSGLRVRPARSGDLTALNDLYNHYVRISPVTFDLAPVSSDQRRVWFAQFSGTGPHRLLVAHGDGELVGYACSHVFRAKEAYATSVETTIYIAAGRVRQGIGNALYGALFEALEGEDLHRAYAGVTLPKEASLALHARFGFRPVGTFEEVGRKLGQYWSVRWLEKPLPSGRPLVQDR
jgi:phosphinothricin acetyltransferase